MQKCRPPSFFLTSTMALHQVLWLGLMALDSNISLRWFLTSSTIGSGIHLNHSLKGVSSVTFMVCSVEWMQPSSTRSNENTSWYSARSWQAASANSGAHELRPLKSSSLNNLPCIMFLILLLNQFGRFSLKQNWNFVLNWQAFAAKHGCFFWSVWENVFPLNIQRNVVLYNFNKFPS